MQIAQALAGYTLGGADLLRRAMGKKKAEEMAKQKAGFLDGAKAKGVDAKTPSAIFELIENFAGYGFNRATRRRTAAHVPDRLPQAPLPGRVLRGADDVRQATTSTTVVKFIAEARAMGIAVLRPDINESRHRLHVSRRSERRRREEGDPVRPRRGEGRRRGRGRGDHRGARARTGRSCRCSTSAGASTRKVNRRVLEALVKCGRVRRPRQATASPRAAVRGARRRRSSAAPRSSATARAARPRCSALLAAAEPAKPRRCSQGEDKYPELEAWSPKELLAFEKEALGFYICGHPLDRYRGDLQRYAIGGDE